jgi:hypothetical protein
MAEFVRICPKCGHINPEYENLCTACNQFIGMESAVPAAPPMAETVKRSPVTHSPEAESAQATRRYVPVAESFYLQLEDVQSLLTVRPGFVLGQAHASSDAQLQIPQTVRGSSFLHRRHCRFELDDKGWRVIAVEQPQSAFTNPTFVNQHKLGPGESHPLSDGDQLRLSGLNFSVRMI